MRHEAAFPLLVLLTCLAAVAQDHDPTRPLYTPPSPHVAGTVGAHPVASPPPPPLHLDYLLYAPQRRLARIDGELLTEGQHIGVWTITHILPDRVVLEHGAEHRTLHPYAVASTPAPVQDDPHAR